MLQERANESQRPTVIGSGSSAVEVVELLTAGFGLWEG